MGAYYNENDPKAAAWLRELIKQNLIAPGDVDERSIEDVTPNELREYQQCHFFAGIGVWSYALRQAGWSDERPVWTGSCPCQPFSAAGKGEGVDDERHLWPAFQRLIALRRPELVLGEQVAGKAGGAWFDIVSTDLEGEGYACGQVVFQACSVGAPHLRQRLYWVADSSQTGQLECEKHSNGEAQPGDDPGGCGVACAGPGPVNSHWRDSDWLFCRDGKWRPVESGTFPLVNGAPARVGRLRGYGNAIVAAQAKEFIKAIIWNPTKK